jgi:hypothetical protein
VIDKVSTFYIAESIPFDVLWGASTLVVALAIGSTDPMRFISKLVQLVGIILFLKAFFSLATISPSPSTVIAKPDCYDQPPLNSWTIKGIFGTARTCNHLMFSVSSALTTMHLMIVVMYIRFGPTAHRLIAYSVLILSIIVSGLLPVVARQSYSADALVGVYLGLLLTLSQSMAFKVLFRFDFLTGDITAPITKLIAKPAEILNEKILPTIAECVRRIELYQLASRNSPGLKMDPTEVEEIEMLYQTMAGAIEMAKAAKPAEPLSPVGMAIPVALVDPMHVVRAASDDGNIDDILNMMSGVHRDVDQSSNSPTDVEIMRSQSGTNVNDIERGGKHEQNSDKP